MKKTFLQISAMFSMMLSLSIAHAQVGPVPGCPGAFGPTKIVQGTNKNGVGNTITANTTWYRDTIYIMKGFVRVTNNATLTIEPGTIIMGYPAPFDTASLIINPGSKLFAVGTSTLPIVFTSCKLQGTRNRGDWGGVAILGNAPNNQVPGPAYTKVQLEGNYGAFHGGNNPTDNSGNIQYVRIEYGGIAIEPNKEINGLTLGSVGSGTIMRNIQVSFANDDSFEWFGGTVNSKNLISWQTIDDDFDADHGYTGYSQFGLAFRDPRVADFSGSNGFEIDNDGSGSNNTPKTAPIFSNYEIWGPIQTSSTPWNKFFKNGAHLKKNSEPSIYNTLFLGFPNDASKKEGGIHIDGASTVANALADRLKIRNSLVAAYLPNNHFVSSEPASSWAPYAGIEAWYRKSGSFDSTVNNVLLTEKKAPFKAIPLFTISSVNSRLNKYSSFQTGTLPALPSFFQSVSFRGAFGGTDWTANWTEFNPQLFVYTAGLPTRELAAEAFFSREAPSTNVLCSPNPTVGATTFSFKLDYDAVAEVAVHDMAGNLVHNTSESFVAGNNFLDYDGAALAPGMYIVKVTSNGTVKTGRFSIVK